MTNVHILSAADAETDGGHGHDELQKMRAHAASDRFGVHALVDDPAAAEIVLFVESSAAAGAYFERVRRHPVFRARRESCYLFSSTDRIVPFLPGVYASVERSWYWPRWTRSGMYLGIHESDHLRYRPDAAAAYLFSFVGSSATHRVRRAVVRLTHPESRIIDTAVERPIGHAASRVRYGEILAASAFVLCPRGGGPASFRLFETMMLGRSPVVISDEWMPPVGPKWDEVAVRVRERDVERVPALLEARREEAAAMGAAARAAWLEWFAPEAAFHRTVEWCLELASTAPGRAGARRALPYVQMLRPYHAARWTLRRAGHGERWRVPRPAELGAAVERARARRSRR